MKKSNRSKSPSLEEIVGRQWWFFAKSDHDLPMLCTGVTTIMQSRRDYALRTTGILSLTFQGEDRHSHITISLVRFQNLLAEGEIRPL